MSRIKPDTRKHPEEKPMDWHRRMRGPFITNYLEFSPELKAGQTEIRRAYQIWIGERPDHFHSVAIHELNEVIKSMGATLDKRTFYGVRLCK